MVCMLMPPLAPCGWAGGALHASSNSIVHHFGPSACIAVTWIRRGVRGCAWLGMKTNPQDRSGGLSDRPDVPTERLSRHISIGIDSYDTKGYYPSVLKRSSYIYIHRTILYTNFTHISTVASIRYSVTNCRARRLPHPTRHRKSPPRPPRPHRRHHAPPPRSDSRARRTSSDLCTRRGCRSVRTRRRRRRRRPPPTPLPNPPVFNHAFNYTPPI